MSDLTGLTTVRVPGKVMLAGEYAVLDGGEALAVAVSRFLTVRLKPVAGLGGCRVHSELWPEPGFVAAGASPADFAKEPLLAAVAHAMAFYGLSDVAVSVTSDLAVSYGIGSSSALRLGVLMAFSAASCQRQGQRPSSADDWICAKEALRLQRQAQAHASGYDLATQLAGGLCLVKTGLEIEQWPETILRAGDEALPILSDLVRVYVGGAGAPTAPLLNSTLDWLHNGERMDHLHELTEALHEAFTNALEEPEDAAALAELAACCGRHRQLFTAAPGFPAGLARDLQRLAGCDRTWSFKTTGAGGEDAVLLVGPAAATQAAAKALAHRGWTPLEADFATHGAKLEAEEEHAHA